MKVCFFYILRCGKIYLLMEDIYKTIEKTSEGLYKEKGSRFISYAFNVISEEEIKKIIQSIRKDHHSARHICYAWRLGISPYTSKMNDDGEPSSTAGRPIFGQIQSFDLTNILIVVVRYFGGTLLGVSGLINAYRNSALDAINKAIIVERLIEKWFIIEFDYLYMNDVMKIFKEEKLQTIETQYAISYKIKTFIRLGEFERVEKRLLNIEGLKINYLA